MLGRVKRKRSTHTSRPVSSRTSRTTPSSAVSYRSANPPGRSSVPLAGSLARSTTSTSFCRLHITATVEALGLKKYSNPQSLHRLLFSLLPSKCSLPQTGQKRNFSSGCVLSIIFLLSLHSKFAAKIKKIREKHILMVHSIQKNIIFVPRNEKSSNN